jgi:hypothetical protein
MASVTDRGKHCEQEVISTYLAVKEKYGEIFPHIGKEKIYDDISEVTKYSVHRIGIVIREFIKGKIRIDKSK